MAGIKQARSCGIRTVIAGIIALVLCFSLMDFNAYALEFDKIKTVKLNTCSIWSIPVFDGDDLAVSCEGNGNLYMLKYDLDLNLKSSARKVASASDFRTPDSISDHKHLFQNGNHFIVFSKRGDGSGGELVLIKLDRNFNRLGKVSVVYNDSPTNDMFLVGDGTSIYVGKYSPSSGGHMVYAFNEELEQQGGAVSIGGFSRNFGELHHANGASAIYDNGKFYLVAPATLEPGANDYFYLLQFDSGWNPVSQRKTIYQDDGDIGIVSGFVKDSPTGDFIINFSKRSTGEQEVIGPLYAAVYSSSWDLLSDSMLINGKFQRPHSVIVDDALFVGYDEENGGFKAYVSKFDISRSEDEIAGEQGNQNEENEEGATDATDTPGQNSAFNPAEVAPGLTLVSDAAQSDVPSGSGGGGPSQQQFKGSTTPVISLAYSGPSPSPIADWWVGVMAPDGFLVLDAANWRWQFIGNDVAGLTPVIQYRLFPFSNVALPPFHFIKSGSYYFFFALDGADNKLNDNIRYVVKKIEVE